MGVVYICGRTPLRCVGARAPAHTRALHHSAHYTLLAETGILQRGVL